MADSFVQLNNDGPGKKIDTRTENVNGDHRQVMVIGDPNTNANVANVTAAGGVQVDGSGVTQPVSAASLPLPTGASTAANQTTANTTLSTISTNTPAVGQATMAASSPVVIASNQSSVPVSLSGNVTVVQPTGTNLHTVIDSGTVTISGTSPVSGTVTAVQPTGTNLHVVVDSAPTTAVTGTFFQATQPVSGTVTANIGTSGALALNSSVTGLQVAQGSTTSGQNGDLVQAAVTNTAPAYTTAQTSPLSMDTLGNLRVRQVSAPLTVSTTAATGVGVTVTLPAVAAQFHQITLIEITKYFTVANAASATPLVVTTTNLPGSLAFTFGQPLGTVGTTDNRLYNPGNPLQSSVVNTATTIVCPATTGIIWRVNVVYYTGA